MLDSNPGPLPQNSIALARAMIHHISSLLFPKIRARLGTCPRGLGLKTFGIKFFFFTLRSFSQCGVLFHAVLACTESNSVSQFWIFNKINLLTLHSVSQF